MCVFSLLSYEGGRWTELGLRRPNINDLVIGCWICCSRMCGDFVHFQRKLAIRPAVFFLLNNEPCLMPVLLLGSFWLFEIPSCWVRSLISHAFVARFGEWKKSKWFDFFVPHLASFAKPSFYPLIPSSLQSPLPSSSCCAFFCSFSFEIARQ